MEKLLTIVMPCYNVEKYLDNGLRTLAQKEFASALEVLIIDDGSKDQTKFIAGSYKEQYPDIFRIISKSNGGHGSVINRGIKEARGKYIRILDGDDWVDSYGLKRLLEAMAERDEDLLADKRCDVHLITREKNHISLPTSVQPNQHYAFSEVCVYPDVARYFMIHNFSVKTDLLRKNRISVTEGVFYEDSEYVMKATGICRSVYFFDIEVYQYLIGNVNQSVSSQNFVRRYGQFDTVTQAMLEFTKRQSLMQKEAGIAQYLFVRARTVVLTQFYIALIYDTDRKRGLERGKRLARLLKKQYPEMYKNVKKKYRLDRLMHYAGMNYHSFQKLRRLLGKKE